MSYNQNYLNTKTSFSSTHTHTHTALTKFMPSSNIKEGRI
jgi:hypothetical protein